MRSIDFRMRNIILCSILVCAFAVVTQAEDCSKYLVPDVTFSRYDHDIAAAYFKTMTEASWDRRSEGVSANAAFAGVPGSAAWEKAEENFRRYDETVNWQLDDRESRLYLQRKYPRASFKLAEACLKAQSNGIKIVLREEEKEVSLQFVFDGRGLPDNPEVKSDLSGGIVRGAPRNKLFRDGYHIHRGDENEVTIQRTRKSKISGNIMIDGFVEHFESTPIEPFYSGCSYELPERETKPGYTVNNTAGAVIWTSSDHPCQALPPRAETEVKFVGTVSAIAERPEVSHISFTLDASGQTFVCEDDNKPVIGKSGTPKRCHGEHIAGQRDWQTFILEREGKADPHGYAFASLKLHYCGVKDIGDRNCWPEGVMSIRPLR